MYLIDTDILIWVLRKNEHSSSANKKYKDLFKKLSRKDTLAISTITIAEIYKNTYPSELVETEELLTELRTYDVTPKIAKQAGLYWQEYSKKLLGLSIIDCLIAATTSDGNATLVTLNKKHFPMKDIKLLDF